MPTVNVDHTNNSNACRDVIGVRGLCNTTYPYYLDTLGISLNKAAKLADSATITARQLVEESIDSAWGDVFNDLRIDGFALAGVRRVYDADWSTNTSGAGTYSFTISRDCDIQTLSIGKAQLKVIGDLDVLVKVEYNGTETTVYDDTLTDETLTINIDSHYPYDELTFSLVATGTGQLLEATNGNPFKVNAHVECDEKLFYCKYWSHLVKAVMYKAAATILNASLFSDRYNDLIVYKKDEIALRVAQLDNSLNLLNRDNRINDKGQYQLEIENINRKLKQIVKQSYCTCCFECDNVISSHIAIP